MTASGVIMYYVPVRRPPVASSLAAAAGVSSSGSSAVAANNNGGEKEDVRCCIYKKISPPVSSSTPLAEDDSPTKFISRNSNQPFYYFIRQGDFDLVWTNIAVFFIAQMIYFYACLNIHNINWRTWFWEVQIGNWAGFSIGCGAHRLWAHKSYDASLPLRIFWALGQTIAGQNCIYIWCRDHRVHHKFSDTDGDPHNTRRGYFFSHVGWLMRKKHPELKIKSKTLDFADLLNDPVVRIQKEYYYYLYWIFAVILPVSIPVMMWGEAWKYSFASFVARYLTTLHSTWFVNSTAHMFGSKPYNPTIAPVENPWVSVTTFGEGYHNYHHTFPWDYSAAELNYGFNFNRKMIDLTAWLGLAFNLKRPSPALIQSAKKRIRKHEEMHDLNGRGY